MLTLTIPSIDAMMELLSTQSKTTIAYWTIDYAECVILPVWLKYYADDPRSQHALTVAHDWLDGKLKLPEVKKIILNECHAAVRAIGQAGSTIHAPTHSIGIAEHMVGGASTEQIRRVRTQMNPDIFMVFDRLPAVLPLYEMAKAKIVVAFPEVRIKVGKTQIGFYSKYLFAALWLPYEGSRAGRGAISG